MFIYFLQRKFFLDNGDGRYLQNKLDGHRRSKAAICYYAKFLQAPVLRGLRQAGRQAQRRRPTRCSARSSTSTAACSCRTASNSDWPKIAVPDKAFENLFAPLRALLLESERHARRRGQRDQPGRAGLHLREVHQPEGLRRLLHPPGDHRVPVRADHPPADSGRRQHARHPRRTGRRATSTTSATCCSTSTRRSAGSCCTTCCRTCACSTRPAVPARSWSRP